MGAGGFCISKWKQCSCRVAQNCWCNKLESVYYHSCFIEGLCFRSFYSFFAFALLHEWLAAYTDHHSNGRSPLTWVHSCFVYWSLLHRKISSDMITFLFRLLIITSMEDLLWHGYFVASFTDHSFTGRPLLVLVIPFFAYWSLLHWKNSSDLGTLLLRIGNCFRGQSVLWRFFVSLKGKETQHKMCAYFKQ